VGDSNKYHVVAVYKKAAEPVRVVRAFELEAVVSEAKLTKDPCVLQKYVRPKGIFACKVKAIFTAGKRNPYASFVITNKKSFFDVSKGEDSLSNYLVKHTDVSVMRNMNVSRSDEAFEQMESLIDFLARKAHLIFKYLEVDFIKEQDGRYFMIGIMAYKVDLVRMAEVTLNLYPFTLNQQDDTAKWELIYPNTSYPNAQDAHQQYKRCALCMLRYKKDLMTRSVPARYIQGVQEFMKTPEVSSSTQDMADVCKDW